mmetsp:Transcript_11057/g.39036  ORF Transcript_11057/g.39036 Transcript_11057/m.39036 type:complete len:114 (+) Transcript_11057:1098-1439(+)
MSLHGAAGIMGTTLISSDAIVDKALYTYKVEFGRAEARIEGNVVMSYETTNFFGELALLKDTPRAADVVASEPCRLLVLGAESFRRLLGPLDAILQERAEAYANVDIEKFKAS